MNAAGLIRPPLAEPLSGEIETWSRKLFASDWDAVSTGFWRSEPGSSRWDFATRGGIIHVIDGAMTVHEDGEQAVEVTAGDVVVFPLGWKGTWEVTRTLSKFYVIYH